MSKSINNWEFEDLSPRRKADLRTAGVKGMTAAALAIEAQVKLLAPVDMGDLRDNISHRVTERGKTGFIEATVGSPHEYAIYQEYGTGEFAENGMGRKGGWFFKDPSGKWWFTYGNKPTKFMRNGFRYANMKALRIIENEYKVRFRP